MKPDGPTARKLGRAVSLERRNAEGDGGDDQKKTGKYIWHTIGDGKVRSEHADRDGETFDWDDPPEGGHPGEAPNCRCWAEDIKDNARSLKIKSPARKAR